MINLQRLWGWKTKGFTFAVILLLMMAGGAIGNKKYGMQVYDWNKSSDWERALYTNGFALGIGVGAAMQKTNPVRMNRILDCINDWSVSQCTAVVDKYLRDHPHQWNEPLPILVFKALDDACQKKRY